MMGGYLTVAIHQCIGAHGSLAMLSLLVEFGADLLAKHPISRTTPLQWLLTGRLQSDRVLDILLQREHPDEVYIQTMHTALHRQFFVVPTPPETGRKQAEERPDVRDQFRRLLTHPRFARYVDYPDDRGTTMLQQAAWVLHAPSVRLLLDAGADAGLPFRPPHGGRAPILPLQLACVMARGLFAAASGATAEEAMMSSTGEILGLDSMSDGRRAQAMETAAELLKWHQAKGDGLFCGITELHLACRMASIGDVQELTDRSMNLACDRGQIEPRVKGCWPGVEGEVTPRELISLDALGAEDEAALHFPGVTAEIEEPSQEAIDTLIRGRGELDDMESLSTSSEALEF